MAEKPKTPEEIFNDDSDDDDQFIDAIEREGNGERSTEFDVEKEKIEGDGCAHAREGTNNSDEDDLVGPEHEVSSYVLFSTYLMN